MYLKNSLKLVSVINGFPFFFPLPLLPPPLPCFSLWKVANGKIQNLEATVELLLTNEGKLKQSILTLEQERAALLKAVEEMQKKIGDTDGKPLLTRQQHMDADWCWQLWWSREAEQETKGRTGSFCHDPWGLTLSPSLYMPYCSKARHRHGGFPYQRSWFLGEKALSSSYVEILWTVRCHIILSRRNLIVRAVLPSTL